MSWKRSLTIHAVFWTYLALGGLAFYHIEYSMHVNNDPPLNQSIINSTFCEELVEAVRVSFLATTSTPSSINHSTPAGSMMKTMEGLVGDVCVNLMQTEAVPSNNGLTRWEYSTALFFAMTTLTTIGYGDFYPMTMPGKIFFILYGFFGIPLTGLLLASISDYFSNGLILIYEKHRRKMDEKRGIFIAALAFLLPGLAAFLFVPAGLFIVIEGWNYLDAIYYCFTTLTTTGFGDFVAGHNVNQNWAWFYRVSLIVWIISGISYWAIIISFVTKAFKSKEIRKRWIKTSQAITKHANVMKRAISSNEDKGTTSFLAQKSKMAFEFALQLTGSMSQLETDDVNSRRPVSLPGIATAMQPRGHLGIGALMSIMMLGADRRVPQHSVDTESDPSSSNERAIPKVEGSVSQNSLGLGSIGEESGFSDDSTKAVSSPEVFLPSFPTVRRPLHKLDKQISSSSLPDGLQKTKRKLEDVKPSRWNKSLMRSSTRPELLSHKVSIATTEKDDNISPTQTLKELLLDAMLILQEAEDCGAQLDDATEL